MWKQSSFIMIHASNDLSRSTLHSRPFFFLIPRVYGSLLKRKAEWNCRGRHPNKLVSLASGTTHAALGSIDSGGSCVGDTRQEEGTRANFELSGLYRYPWHDLKKESLADREKIELRRVGAQEGPSREGCMKTQPTRHIRGGCQLRVRCCYKK